MEPKVKRSPCTNSAGERFCHTASREQPWLCFLAECSTEMQKSCCFCAAYPATEGALPGCDEHLQRQCSPSQQWGTRLLSCSNAFPGHWLQTPRSKSQRLAPQGGCGDSQHCPTGGGTFPPVPFPWRWPWAAEEPLRRPASRRKQRGASPSPQAAPGPSRRRRPRHGPGTASLPPWPRSRRGRGAGALRGPSSPAQRCCPGCDGPGSATELRRSHSGGAERPCPPLAAAAGAGPGAARRPRGGGAGGAGPAEGLGLSPWRPRAFPCPRSSGRAQPAAEAAVSRGLGLRSPAPGWPWCPTRREAAGQRGSCTAPRPPSTSPAAPSASSRTGGAWGWRPWSGTR